jgi:hypothetical protein
VYFDLYVDIHLMETEKLGLIVLGIKAFEQICEASEKGGSTHFSHQGTILD